MTTESINIDNAALLADHCTNAVRFVSSESINIDNAAFLAAAYCRLYDAERAWARARASFEGKMIDATAGEVEHARQDLPTSLAAPFSAAVREALARRLATVEAPPHWPR